MKVIKISPRGYCQGVIKALKLVEEAISNREFEKPIHLLGEVVHNSFVTEKLRSLDVICHLCSQKQLDILDEISGGTVVFSAHGVADSVYQKAKDKGLKIVDTTCKYVFEIKKEIKEKVSEGYTIFYLGNKNHPEVEAALSLSEKIFLIENQQIPEVENEKIFVVSQTTLSIFDFDIKCLAIKTKYPNAIFKNTICRATTKRQEAIIKQAKEADLLIVVGDKKSSNSNKLVKIGSEIGIKSVLINSLASLDKKVLEGVKTVAVTSGASTPDEITNLVINYLETL